MSQNWTEDPYEPSYEIAFTMLATENNFKCLRSNFAGSGLPPSPTAGQLYFETTSKEYQFYDGSTWNDLASNYIRGDSSLKLWVYSNTAIPGWIIDSSVYDVVLAFKGGTQAYNVNGGVVAGTWDGAGFVHNHAWWYSKYQECPPTEQSAKTFTKDGVLQDINDYIDWGSCMYPGGRAIKTDEVEAYNKYLSGVTLTADEPTYQEYMNYTSESLHDGANSYRPAAAVGTMQYPDMS